jgi:type III secretion protein L
MSKVIKSGAGVGHEVRRTIVQADVFDAKLEADRLMADARAQADRELQAVRDEVERIRRRAEVEGRERGLAAVTELLVGARAAAARARANAESELRTLAVRIAEKILGRELQVDPGAVVDVVRAALKHAGEPRELLLRCAAEDLEALERGKPRLLERCRAAQVAVFRADPTVSRGGCIVETELGVIDARLSTQLDAIERALRGEPE